MAARTSMTDAAAGVPGSTMVTVMARNGVDFGITLSGTGDRWFPAPANPVDGLYFPGYTVEEATANSRRMLSMTLGTNPAFTLPPLNFGGTPADIDARLVVDSGVLPIINTGIAHRQAGVGQIGAGITTAPMECFNEAPEALAADRGAQSALADGRGAQSALAADRGAGE